MAMATYDSELEADDDDLPTYEQRSRLAERTTPGAAT